MAEIEPALAALERDGYVLVPGLFSAAAMQSAIDAWTSAMQAPSADSLLTTTVGVYGARNVLKLWPGSLTLARTPRLVKFIRSILGPSAGLVRGLFFDKPPGQSWNLPFHQDRTIAVAVIKELRTFQKPTTKAGVPHVEAPTWLLQRMVTARIHFDPMTPDNGPLQVIPGSHHAVAASASPLTVLCQSGDVLLMRPLVAHASIHSRPGVDQHRRILHLEFAADPDLPDDYAWHAFHPLDPVD